MPDTGMFYLYEVCCHPTRAAGQSYAEIDFIRAECNACRTIFKATAPPILVALECGGAVLSCPTCEARQAIAGARFAEYMIRFPSGNCDVHREAKTDPAVDVATAATACNRDEAATS